MSTAAPAVPAAEFDLGVELHAPELYQPLENTVPYVATLDDIGPREIAFYREHGYIAVREAFTPAEVDAALAGLVDLIMGKNPAFTGITVTCRTGMEAPVSRVGSAMWVATALPTI